MALLEYGKLNDELKKLHNKTFNDNLLEKYNKTPNDLKNEGYHYICSDRNPDKFKLIFGNRQLPGKKFECLCEHKIDENCYIINNNDEYDSIIIVGNVCKNKYMDHICKKLLCEKCKKEHTNRSFNLCNVCIKPKMKISVVNLFQIEL